MFFMVYFIFFFSLQFLVLYVNNFQIKPINIYFYMQNVANTNFANLDAQGQFRTTNVSNNYSPDARGTFNTQPFVTQIRPVTSIGGNNVSTLPGNNMMFNTQIVGQQRVSNNVVRGTQIVNAPPRQLTPPRQITQTYAQPQQVVFNRPVQTTQIINRQQTIDRPSIAFSQIIRGNQPHTITNQQFVQPMVPMVPQQRVVENLVRPSAQQIYIPPQNFERRVTINQPQPPIVIQSQQQIQTEVLPTKVERRESFIKEQEPLVQTRKSNWQSYYEDRKYSAPPIVTPQREEKSICSPWLFIPLALLALGGLIAGIVLAAKSGGSSATGNTGISTAPGVSDQLYPNYTVTVETTVIDQSANQTAPVTNTTNATANTTNITTNTTIQTSTNSSSTVNAKNTINTTNATTKIVSVEPLTVPPTVTTIVNDLNASSTNTSASNNVRSNSSATTTGNTSVAPSFNSNSSGGTVFIAPIINDSVQVAPQYAEPIIYQAWDNGTSTTTPSTAASPTGPVPSNSGTTSPTTYAIDPNQSKQPMLVDMSTRDSNTVATPTTAPTQSGSFSSSSLTQRSVEPTLVSPTSPPPATTTATSPTAGTTKPQHFRKGNLHRLEPALNKEQ